MRVVAAVLLLLVLSGCSEDDDPLDRVATYEPEGEGGDSALLTGIVVLEGGCFYVEVPRGDRLLPLFPDDTVEINGDTLSYHELEYTAGDELSLGGGRLPPGSEVARQASIPDGCDTDLDLWVVSQD
jgi:hypothetical protein